MRLKIEGITKEYTYKTALDQVSLELTEGVYGLLGPNGAGKTTLMRILADVLEPGEGQITVDGRNKKEMKEEYRALLGYLPQDCGFYRNYSAYKFLMYIAALKGMNKKEAALKSRELLKLVNLEQEWDNKIGGFSGGMKQRLGIAQALLNEPKILILDEPTAGLDPKERVRFRSIISQISKDRIILLSTHIISDIEFIAKELLFLKDGKLIKGGKPQALLKELDGKLWSVQCTEEQLEQLTKEFRVSNAAWKVEGISARILSDEKPAAYAISQEPRLEDLYLYFFDEEPEEGGSQDAGSDRV